jgi:CheY-like chemotaxis protein
MPAPPKRVLVVDKDARDRKALAQLLSRDGHSVAAVETAAAAIAKMDLWAPDAMLLDLTLPRTALSGVLKRLRAFDHLPPILGLRPRDAARSPEPTELAGMLFKPLHAEAARTAVRRALGLPTRRSMDPPPPRAHRRMNVTLETVVLSADGRPIAQGKIVNLSSRGAQPHLDTRLEVGSRIVMDFRLPGHGVPLSIPARVQWRNPATSGFAFGVLFEDLTPDVTRALEAVVSAVR